MVRQLNERLRNCREKRENVFKAFSLHSSLSNAKVKLSELHNRVLENLPNNRPKTKRLAFVALDIRIYASYDAREIRDVIPLELAPLNEHWDVC